MRYAPVNIEVSAGCFSGPSSTSNRASSAILTFIRHLEDHQSIWLVCKIHLCSGTSWRRVGSSRPKEVGTNSVSYACRTSIRNPSFQNVCPDLTRLSKSDSVLVVRKIKGVGDFKDVSVVSPRTGAHGWPFASVSAFPDADVDPNPLRCGACQRSPFTHQPAIRGAVLFHHSSGREDVDDGEREFGDHPDVPHRVHRTTSFPRTRPRLTSTRGLSAEKSTASGNAPLTITHHFS